MTNQIGFDSHVDKTKVFLWKLWLPFIILVACLTVFWGGSHWTVTALPPALVALFYLSTAQVRVDGRTLRYRRLFKWRDVRCEEILECKVSVAPGIGVLKLRRFVFPFGRVYFIREEPAQMLWPGGQSQLTRLINARCKEEPSLSGPSGREDADSPRERDRAMCAGAAFVGVVMALLSRTLLPDVPLQFDPAGYPRWIAAYEQFQRAIALWPWNLATGFLLLAVIIGLKFKKAWGFAFALGGVLGSSVLRMFG